MDTLAAAIALKLVDEGTPVACIARATEIPSTKLYELLVEAKLDGRLLSLPRDDWPPGYPRDQRALQLARMATKNHAALLLTIKRVFALPTTAARLLILLLQHEQLAHARVDLDHSFTVAAEAFITAKLEKERSGKVAERDLRSVFIAAWGERPVSEITKTDVLEIILTKTHTAPQMARALLVLIKRFFGWVVDQQIYGLSTSPCEGLLATKLIGELQSRSRRLTDAEIFAFWRATERMKYPVGPVYRSLLLTGLRLNEAAQLSWPEVQGDIIVIPASRMKGKEGKAREHLVPLSSSAQEVIASLPRIKNGPHLFSMSAGKRPLTMTGPIKADLDRRMQRTLKAMARRRGEDHRAVTLASWVNHDLRRVVRSGLSALRVEHNVAEAILGHQPPGIVRTYNLHQFADEKAEALEAWAQRIKSIVSPVPAAPANGRAVQAGILPAAPSFERAAMAGASHSVLA